jgi:hypothetical protein
MNTTLARRLAAGTVLAAAPALIALSTAAGHADAGPNRVDHPTVTAPSQHQAFPGQDPQRDRPWLQTPRHHHHVWNHRNSRDR